MLERSFRRVSASAAGTQLVSWSLTSLFSTNMAISETSWDTVVRQVQWSSAVQTPVNYHCQLEEHPIGDVKPMKLVMQYLTQAMIELPSADPDSSGKGRKNGAKNVVLVRIIQQKIPCTSLQTFGGSEFVLE